MPRPWSLHTVGKPKLTPRARRSLKGEGPRAFRRLQEEIVQQANDHSIFAWTYGWNLIGLFSRTFDNNARLFATSPVDFRHGGYIIKNESFKSADLSHYAMTNRGLQIDLLLWQPVSDMPIVYGALNCSSYLRSKSSLFLPFVISNGVSQEIDIDLIDSRFTNIAVYIRDEKVLIHNHVMKLQPDMEEESLRYDATSRSYIEN